MFLVLPGIEGKYPNVGFAVFAVFAESTIFQSKFPMKFENIVLTCVHAKFHVISTLHVFLIHKDPIQRNNEIFIYFDIQM